LLARAHRLDDLKFGALDMKLRWSLSFSRAKGLDSELVRGAFDMSLHSILRGSLSLSPQQALRGGTLDLNILCHLDVVFLEFHSFSLLVILFL
jgi:hypothetical protein